MTMAFLDERDALLEIANDSLNLMAYLDDYQKKEREHGERSPLAIVAKGKLFGILQLIRKKKLLQRILQSKEQLERAQREYLKKWKKARG